MARMLTDDEKRVWETIQATARRWRIDGKVLETLTNGVPNKVTAVEDAAIWFQSDRPAGAGGPSKVTRGDVLSVWRQLQAGVERPNTQRYLSLAVVRQMLGNVRQPVPPPPSPKEIDRNLTDCRDAALRLVVERSGQAEFRRRLLAAYDGRCAITGCDVESVLEAAHIIPYSGNNDIVQNGLLLRSDIHTLFDVFHLRIDPNTWTIVIRPELRRSVYQDLHGKPLTLPEDLADRPSPKYMNHRLASIERVVAPKAPPARKPKRKP